MSKYTQNKNRGASVVKGTLVICTIMILICTLLLGGCMNPVTKSDDNDQNATDIDPSIEERIKQDWENQVGSKLWRFEYYGTHNGYVAFYVLGTNTVEINIKIAGTIFRHSYENTIYLWKDSSFYEMVDAYLQGLITPENISKIGEIHRNRVREIWSGDDESFNDWYFDPETIFTIIP